MAPGRLGADVHGVQARRREHVLGRGANDVRAHDAGERLRALDDAVADGHVLARHELAADGAADVAGMELADVAAADESNDRNGHAPSLAFE